MSRQWVCGSSSSRKKEARSKQSIKDKLACERAANAAQFCLFEEEVEKRQSSGHQTPAEYLDSENGR